MTQTVCLEDTTVKFEIWDTAGQERYHSLAPMYYRGAQAAIIVYDVTNVDTFARAKVWVKELQVSSIFILFSSIHYFTSSWFVTYALWMFYSDKPVQTLLLLLPEIKLT